MAASAVVAVVGARALRADLNRMGSELNGPLYDKLRTAAKAGADPVANRARSTVPHDSGTLADSIRVSTTKTGASIRMGRASVPYAGWIEFGGTRPQGPTDRAARPFMPSGRYLFPAARDLASHAADLYSKALQEVFDSPAVWTNTGETPGSVHD